MGYKYKKTFSKQKKKEFANKMNEIDVFCNRNRIINSLNNDSFYFTLNGINYRVSNHSVESSNSGAFDELYGQKRALYHPEGRKNNIVYIHASKTRIIDIYNDLKNGYKLDKRGNRKE